MKKTDFLGRSLAPLSQALVLLVASTAYAGSYTLVHANGNPYQSNFTIGGNNTVQDTCP